ncbi:hypothetical protein TNCV_820301 [Trichonephila clavipes]|nr:hypothetical protein TNCV_820301 [Trichonephila clavipes]
MATTTSCSSWTTSLSGLKPILFPTKRPRLLPEEYIEKLQAQMEEMHHLVRERIGMVSENRTQLPRRRQSVVIESETSQRTLSEAADQLGRSLHSPKKTMTLRCGYRNHHTQNRR